MEKFIYVFDSAARDQLMQAGLTMLKADEESCVWIFLREDAERLGFDCGAAGFAYVLSNTLTF